MTLVSFKRLLLLTALLAQTSQAQLVQGLHVDAQLVAETTAAVPGQSLWVALRLVHQPRWHTYWKNPGDAGKPTEIAWHLPEGVSAGPIVWPTPKRIELPADLVDFGYEDEIFLLTQLTVAESFNAARLALGASVHWLECDDVCIPGGAELSLELPVQTAPPVAIDPQWAPGFARTRASFPRQDIAVDAMYSVLDGQIKLVVQATAPIFAGARKISFIPGEHRVFDYTDPPVISSQLSSLQLSQARHPRLDSSALNGLGGLLLVSDEQGQTVYQIAARPALAGQIPDDLKSLVFGAGPARADIGLGMIFVFALLGGMILNLMPCVFPVLSLKVMSLAASRDSACRERVLHALVYGAGIVLAFLVLALVLLSLQAGGAAIGWGFHLQAPVFVALLVYLFLLLALSLSGVLELGTGIMGLGSGLAEREGYSGSFFTGVLATVVASPCTAPFMGTALGFALTQTMPVALAVFVALGLGMALPFVLLASLPALTRFLPRPGAWMLKIKHLLALPLYATVLWLLWVLGRQAGMAAVLMVGAGAAVLALAVWFYIRTVHSSAPAAYGKSGLVALVLAFTLVLASLGTPFMAVQPTTPLAEDSHYERYSDARLAELRSGGVAVFVNMTASWCITCLVNERMALDSEAVSAAMSAAKVTYLKGDWTNNDPEITAVLKRYNTSGVPLYLLFPADPGKPANVLPQILTESILLDALARI
ncbi:MAG: protein-disulfide reductase DsbD family protein [Pseudomonadales bacterium]|nr:protein-disulfide reductase DsbD family protein [Pseudomonadales bacterium]